MGGRSEEITWSWVFSVIWIFFSQPRKTETMSFCQYKDSVLLNTGYFRSVWTVASMLRNTRFLILINLVFKWKRNPNLFYLEKTTTTTKQKKTF